MPRRTLYGHRGGTTSYEVDRDTDLAPRTSAWFRCPADHVFEVCFSSVAELPAFWVCRQHGIESCRRVDDTQEHPPQGKQGRTQWMLLLERRTPAELEILLADTLTAIRRQGGARPGSVRLGDRTYSFRYGS